jgi:hypothetical protein
LANEAAMQVPANTNPDTDLGLMLYDVFDLTVSKDQQPGKVEKPQPRITFFKAQLKSGVVNVPDWAKMKKQLGGAP